jgi:catechol 2,3-dioxygenase-like lactoylglutathione lyase family enzyme
VNIDVDDLEKAVRFYTAALELHVGRRFGAGAVELLRRPGSGWRVRATRRTPGCAVATSSWQSTASRGADER